MNVRQIPFLLIGFALVALIALIIFKAEKAEAPTVDGTHPAPNQNVPAAAYANASVDDIFVDLPQPGAVVGKKFSVLGKARGPWFFEASFPVVILDKNGAVLDQTPAQAQSDWMTSGFVPFKADLSVPESYIGPATVVLKKDNPSGMPEKEASMSYPITVEY